MARVQRAGPPPTTESYRWGKHLPIPLLSSVLRSLLCRSRMILQHGRHICRHRHIYGITHTHPAFARLECHWHDACLDMVPFTTKALLTSHLSPTGADVQDTNTWATQGLPGRVTQCHTSQGGPGVWNTHKIFGLQIYTCWGLHRDRQSFKGLYSVHATINLALD